MGLIPQIREDLEKLRQEGFSISQPVINSVLQQAGEI
ncbi:MAG: DUF3368 domain-containing protein [Chloroflexi bacterium]|nr:DUF3368 domain-containing protein [Chloroflexota bacterium]